MLSGDSTAAPCAASRLRPALAGRQPPRRRPGPVRAAIRDRGPRATPAPGPMLMMMRHTSIVDNMLPDALVGHAHGIGLRFVIKRELQMLPTIDIGGRWVPTHFVRRGSGDTAGEVAALRALAHDLGPGEGIMIYPEGTRPTAAKLARAQAGDRRAPAGDRPARRAPATPAPAAPRRPAGPARRGRRGRRRHLRPRRLRRLRARRRRLVAEGWSGRRSGSASGVFPAAEVPTSGRSGSPGSTTAGRSSTTGSRARGRGSASWPESRRAKR